MSVEEAKLEDTGAGLRPAGPGWFVLGAREACWLENEEFGRYTRWEGAGDAGFEQVGINVGVLQPGQPACFYHAEEAQEGFLVLSGEALLVVEGEERPLRAWDFVHCPAGTRHVIVGAGSGPCAVLAVGARARGAGVVYPVDATAARHGASVAAETDDPRQAYAGTSKDVPVAYVEGDLPG